MDFNKEYSEKFDELRKNRIRVAFTNTALWQIITGKDLCRQFQPWRSVWTNIKRPETQNICAIWRTMPCLNSCIHSIRKDIFVQQTAGKVQGLLG